MIGNVAKSPVRPAAPVLGKPGSPPSPLLARSLTTAPNPGPRAGFFSKVRGIFRSLVCCCSRGESQSTRLRTLQTLYQNQAQQAVINVVDAITSQTASPMDVAVALETAATQIKELRSVGVPADFALVKFAVEITKASDEYLLRLAHAFGGAVVRDAQQLSQSLSRSEGGAEFVLANLEQSVLHELNDRLPREASLAALSTAVYTLRENGAGKQIGAQLHATFDGALPLVRAGLRQAAPIHQDVDELVWDELRKLPATDLAGLLEHAYSEDLARLKAVAASQAQSRAQVPRGPELATAIDEQIAARTTRLAQAFRAHEEQVCAPQNGLVSVDHRAFHNDLIALAAALEKLEAHCRLHQIECPLTGPERARLRESVADLTARAFGPHGRAQRLGPGELVRLSSALKVLGLPAGDSHLNALLRPAQEACLERRRENFRAQFLDFAARAAQTDASPSGTRQTMQSLAALEAASRALQAAQAAFDREPAQAEIIRECLEQTTPAQASALAAQLNATEHLGMRSALHVGAQLASAAHQRQLQERFTHMADLYELVLQATPGPSAAATLTPVGHEKFAAQNLSAQARQMLRADYGLQIPESGAPALHAGRFNPLQVQTTLQVFEAELSPTESTVVTVGQYQVGKQFYEDAQREGALFRIEAQDSSPVQDPGARPAVDHPRSLDRSEGANARPSAPRLVKMPVRGDADYGSVGAEEATHLVEKGFERLLKMCGGNAELARTVTMYGSQRLFAGLHAGIFAQGLPVAHLPDGTPATLIGCLNSSEDAALHKQVSFLIGENGRPQLDLDWRIEGRAFLVGPNGNETVLSPESYLQVHCRAEIDAQGRLRLLEAPSYRFELQPDEFQASNA